MRVGVYMMHLLKNFTNDVFDLNMIYLLILKSIWFESNLEKRELNFVNKSIDLKDGI